MFNKKCNKIGFYILVALLVISACLNIYFMCKMNIEIWPPKNSGMDNSGPSWDE